MSFDINEVVFDSKGTYQEEKAARYEEALMGQFVASPEGQAIKEKGTELGWARAMIHYAITYPGVTPPTMTTGDLEEVISRKLTLDEAIKDGPFSIMTKQRLKVMQRDWFEQIDGLTLL